MLLPDYKHVRITDRGTIILKASFWQVKRMKYHYLEFCFTVLAPLVSNYQYGKPEVSIAFYLNAYKIVQKQEAQKAIDLLYAQFSQWKSPLKEISIETEIKTLVNNDNFIVVEHNDGEELSPLQLKLRFSKTAQLTIMLLIFFGTIAAL